MSTIKISVPGKPVGKARARVTAHGTYTPPATRSAGMWIAHCACQQVGKIRLTGPLRVRIAIGIAPPASWPSGRRDLAIGGDIRPTSRPDLDNYCKLILDALNNIIWLDDAQIVEMTARKFYAEPPLTEIEIEEIICGVFDHGVTVFPEPRWCAGGV
jgi:Holliday junction resolvase RusA-like endonuclease